MPLYCVSCAERRFGEVCKCGERDAEQIPPLDGFVTTEGERMNSEILKVLCGSRAYGLENPDSDYDYHAVYVTPTTHFFQIGKMNTETAWVEGEDKDQQSWEIGHFLKLAVHNNPTILETFVAPVEHAAPWGRTLRKLFPAFLARQRIYDAFRGYAKNQRVKMLDNKEAEVRTWKFAVAYLRVLAHGIELLSTGTYNPKITDPEFNQFLRDVKAGVKYSKGQIIDETDRMLASMEIAYENSSIQLEPDLERINKFIVDVRTAYW